MKSVAFDPLALFAVLLLILWALGTFVFEAPGWIHALLTIGVFLLIYRIVARATPSTTRGE